MSTRVRKPAQPVRRRPGEILAEVGARVADRQVKVALAAYFIAQQRGFEPGHELDDWLAAEAQIAVAERPSLAKPIQAAELESIS